MPDQTSQNRNKLDFRRWMGIGFEFGGVVAVFGYIGFKLDERFNTGPWFMLAGFLLSCIGMLYLIVKEASDFRRK